jgi:hypothetical protein
LRIISNRILDVKTQYPIDLLVQIKPMPDEFIERQISFAREIMSRGMRLM